MQCCGTCRYFEVDENLTAQYRSSWKVGKCTWGRMNALPDSIIIKLGFTKYVSTSMSSFDGNLCQGWNQTPTQSNGG